MYLSKIFFLERTSWFLVLHLAFPSPEKSKETIMVFYFNAAFPFDRQTPWLLENRKY